MSENSKIEWCDHTFNPWVGCAKVSPACDYCYAESWAKRAGMPELWRGERRRTIPANWRRPLRWNEQHAEFFAEHGRRQRVFCASLADVFDNQVPKEWRDELWELIARTPNLDWLLLTKRPHNIPRMLHPLWGNGWKNVWLGTTAENQEEYDRRWPCIAQVPAAIRFVSAEPLFGPLNMTKTISLIPFRGKTAFILPKPDWVITGGESGHKARPMHPDWARGLRDQCQDAGVPFFFKQWGEWAPFNSIDPRPDDAPRGIVMGKETIWRVGKKSAGRRLDGRTWDEFPEAAK